MDYYIEIKLDPDLFNEVPYYFWCIIKHTEICSSNAGHGWSKSIISASYDAYEYYKNSLILKDY